MKKELDTQCDECDEPVEHHGDGIPYCPACKRLHKATQELAALAKGKGVGTIVIPMASVMYNEAVSNKGKIEQEWYESLMKNCLTRIESRTKEGETDAIVLTGGQNNQVTFITKCLSAAGYKTDYNPVTSEIRITWAHYCL